jgi:hypothetical protein
MPEIAYWNSDVCANTIIDLSWDDGVVSRQYSCIDVVVKNKSLDFAILRLRPVVGSGGTVGQPVAAQFSNNQVNQSTNVFVVHHAQCKPKLVSRSCRTGSVSIPAWTDSAGNSSTVAPNVNNSFPRFTHDCDTEPGASGAPIFDFNGKVIGLHHAGFARDSQCRPIDFLNKAVKIDTILDYIRPHRPSISSELIP